MNPGPGEILVAVDPHVPTLAGSVRVASLPATPFVGWLGLISALQEAAELLAADAGGGKDASADGAGPATHRAAGVG